MTQRISRLAAHRFQHAAGRIKWTFIGVEHDQLHHAGLFAWYIGPPVMPQAIPETAHFSVQISEKQRRGGTISLAHHFGTK
jgi:hypothetical protein